MMHSWHYEIIVRGTLCGEDIDTEQKARDHLALQHGQEAGETAKIRRAGEED